MCPICYEEMTGFQMLQHFHSNHKDAILDCPAFVFNLYDHSEMPSTYIYQEGDNLFFLYISYSKSENTIKLELVYMGSNKVASNIYHQFTVTSENKEFFINFSSKPSCANEFSLGDTSNMSGLIYIKFKIIYQNLKFCTITENENSSSSSINNSLKKLKVNKEETNQIIEFSPECNPQCFICKEICIFSFYDTRTIDYYYSPIYHDFICFYCFQWLTCKDKIKEFHFYVKHSIPSTFRSRFCKWDCGKDFKFSEIVPHEIFCEKRTQYYDCPVQNCQFQSFASPLSNHLKTDHDYKVYASFFQITKLPIKCFLFVEDQIIHFQLTAQNEYNMECNIVSNDHKIKSEWKPHVLFFNGQKLTPLVNLPNTSSTNLSFSATPLVNHPNTSTTKQSLSATPIANHPNTSSAKLSSLVTATVNFPKSSNNNPTFALSNSSSTILSSNAPPLGNLPETSNPNAVFGLPNTSSTNLFFSATPIVNLPKTSNPNPAFALPNSSSTNLSSSNTPAVNLPKTSNPKPAFALPNTSSTNLSSSTTPVVNLSNTSSTNFSFDGTPLYDKIVFENIYSNLSWTAKIVLVKNE
ncbi:uncharacterized protein LOC126881985 isoform X2 [Diabrotica virgifera virgifera]|nr:uncharacterized protein LOC126881985 isoform X2 [Diabrotica virgifera virgifera]